MSWARPYAWWLRWIYERPRTRELSDCSRPPLYGSNRSRSHPGRAHFATTKRPAEQGGPWYGCAMRSGVFAEAIHPGAARGALTLRRRPAILHRDGLGLSDLTFLAAFHTIAFQGGSSGHQFEKGWWLGAAPAAMLRGRPILRQCTNGEVWRTISRMLLIP